MPLALTTHVPEPPLVVVLVELPLVVVVLVLLPPQLMEAEPEPHQTVAQLAPLADTVIVPLPPP